MEPKYINGGHSLSAEHGAAIGMFRFRGNLTDGIDSDVDDKSGDEKKEQFLLARHGRVAGLYERLR